MGKKKYTDEQLIEWLTNGGTCTGFAKEHKLNSRGVRLRRAKLADKGRLDEIGIKMNVPEGRKMGKVTGQYNAKGELIQFWPRFSEDTELLESLKQSAREVTTSIPYVDIPKCKSVDKGHDVIPWLNIGDGHLGMVAYDKEVGHNFDLKIAEAELCYAMARQIDMHEGYDRCVIQDMGDMTHYENFGAKTEASGHDLDFDTRFPKMIKVYRRTMEFIVNYALSKFQHVDVIINQGNHSRTNDIWMAEHLRALFANSSRVTVLNNECIFIPYRMGNTFVMSHHTDKCKAQKLIDVMCTDFRQDFGEAKYKYIDGGHIHTKTVSEVGDVTIETFNQLAPSDKYAHDGGWRSRSCLTCVLRSKTYGEVGRTMLTAEQVKDEIMKLEPGTSVHARREVYTV
ncbi:MAG: hypothetical protein ACPHUL_00100 [Marinomonas gallaica]